jgi:hypothetical protein
MAAAAAAATEGLRAAVPHIAAPLGCPVSADPRWRALPGRHVELDLGRYQVDAPVPLGGVDVVSGGRSPTRRSTRFCGCRFWRRHCGSSNPTWSPSATSTAMSEGTVKTHVGRILAKLGLHDGVHAVITSYQTGLVSPTGTRTEPATTYGVPPTAPTRPAFKAARVANGLAAPRNARVAGKPGPRTSTFSAPLTQCVIWVLPARTGCRTGRATRFRARTAGR